MFSHSAAGICTAFDSASHSYPAGLDYIGNVEYQSSECFWFMHKISDLLTALLGNGMELRDFAEYPYDLDGTPDPAVSGKFPFSYLLTAIKK